MTGVARVEIPELAVVGKPLGRHVEHDPRSRGFAVTELAETAIVAVHHRRYGGPFDQGELGSCTGNAIEGAMNTAPFHKTGMTLSTEATALDTYEKATVLDGFPGSYPPDDTGSSGLAVCKVLLREKRIAAYRHAFSLTGALSALMVVPVITGVPWFEGFDKPNAAGLVKISGQIRGGHEFEILGFEPAASAHPILDGLVAAENSWGLSYGVKGRFFFTARTWASLLDQQGDVSVPTPLAA